MFSIIKSEGEQHYVLPILYIRTMID